MTAPKPSDPSSNQAEHPAPVEPASSPPGQPATVVPLALRKKRRFVRLAWLAGLLGLVVLAVLFINWWSFRLTHSITDDAFVEADIVNIAAQSVSGRLDRFLVEENSRVEQGQVLAEIDPVPYRDQVNIARSKVDTAQAEFRRQEAGLARLKLEVPIRIEIARRTLATAQAEQGRAKESVKLTDDEVERGIDEAAAGLEASKADLVLAQQEYTRFTNLQKEAAVPLRRARK